MTVGEPNLGEEGDKSGKEREQGAAKCVTKHGAAKWLEELAAKWSNL
jgi:hypothetical protein